MKPHLAISRPGATFSAEWLEGWEDLLLRLAPFYDLTIIPGFASQVCAVRADHAQAALKLDPPCNFFMTIDDDNPPSAFAAVQLLADLTAEPQAGLVAGWYFCDIPGIEQCLSFGRSFSVIGSTAVRRLPADLEDFQNQSAPHVQEIDWTGFGMTVMRRELLAAVGPEAFLPVQEGTEADWGDSLLRGFIWDDMAFSKAAKQRGFRLFVDRRVKLKHLKFRATIDLPNPSGGGTLDGK